jgi:hypothetical protein
LIAPQAPRARARSSFSSLDEVRITRAPAARANSRANVATPPVPRASTVSPGRTPQVSTSACQVVTAAQGSVAASSNERLGGIGTASRSSSSAYSASIPSAGEPRAE